MNVPPVLANAASSANTGGMMSSKPLLHGHTISTRSIRHPATREAYAVGEPVNLAGYVLADDGGEEDDDEDDDDEDDDEPLADAAGAAGTAFPKRHSKRRPSSVDSST